MMIRRTAAEKKQQERASSTKCELDESKGGSAHEFLVDKIQLNDIRENAQAMLAEGRAQVKQ
jgi:hypothetical protein